MGKPEEVLARYGHQVEFSSSKGGCWHWRGYVGPDGYGSIGITKASKLRAHRVFYLSFRGPHQAGLVLDHLCRNRACVNPAHLEPVTIRENIERGLTARARRKCTHPQTPENVYISPAGKKQCRPCNRLREARRTRNKEKVYGEVRRGN